MSKSSKTKKTITPNSSSPEPMETTTDIQESHSSEEGDTALEDLFLDCIKDIYWAENHLVKSLPKMKKAAGAEKLQQAFTDHLEVTKGHVARLEQVFELLGKKKQAKKCDAMEGISIEGEGLIEETEAGTVARDVALILAAQKVEHYEISTYGGLAQLAKTLGKEDIAAILAQTLAEEKEADVLLTNIAENDLDYQSAKA